MSMPIRISVSVITLAAILVMTAPAHAREARWVGEALNGRACNDFIGAEPRANVFDYTDPHDRADQLEIVEQIHFTASIRRLQHPNTLNNLEYTLGRFPNHHRALYAMIRYATEAVFAQRAEQDWASMYRGRESQPPECYLQRAMDFARDDHRVRTLAGIYYHRVDEHERAREAYEQAISMDPDFALAHYSYGLLLTDMEHFEAAQDHARKAYELGYPLEGLRRRLASAGHPLDD